MPDLRAVTERFRPTVEATMVDECTITRDVHVETDDVLDPTTLELAPPTGDTTTIYTGNCLISPLLDQRQVTEVGRDVNRRRYQIRVPASTAEITVGDRVTVTSSEHGWPLEGTPLTVIDVTARSFATSRRLVAEEQTGEAR